MSGSQVPKNRNLYREKCSYTFALFVPLQSNTLSFGSYPYPTHMHTPADVLAQAQAGSVAMVIPPRKGCCFVAC